MVSADDVQRLFLQAVLSRGVLSEKLAQTLWKRCVEAIKSADDTVDITHSGDKSAWDAFISKINNSIDALDLEFRHLSDENTGREVYALVNRKADEIAQMATDYSASEILYFKAIVEQIILAANDSFSISSLAALREVNALKTNMTKTHAEVVLSSLVAKGWLLKSKRGRYSLSTRTLLELGPYIRTTYPDDIRVCETCEEILTRGVACVAPNCDTCMHHHCFSKLKRRSCPTCSKDWPQEANDLTPIGEAAVKDGQDDNRRRDRRKVSTEGSEDDETVDSDNPSQTHTAGRRSLRGNANGERKGKGRAREGSEDEMDVDYDFGDDKDDETPATQLQGRRRSRR